MPGFKSCKGQLCESGCLILRYGFNVPGPDLTARCDAHSGTWTIVDNALTTSDAYARLSYVDGPVGTECHRVRGRVRGASGDKPRLLMMNPENEPSDPYFTALELEIGGPLRVITQGQFDGGAESVRIECDFSSSPDTWYTLELCHWIDGSGNSLHLTNAYVDGVKIGVVDARFPDQHWPGSLGGRGGFGTGDTAEDVAFDDLELLSTQNEDCDDCGGCFFPVDVDGVDGYGQAWAEDRNAELTIAGITGGEGCADNNGTHILGGIACGFSAGLGFGIKEVYFERASATEVTCVARINNGGVQWSRTFSPCETPEDETSYTLNKDFDDAACTYPATVDLEFVLK